MNPGKALIIVHDGFTDSEFIVAYYRCREEGINVMVATITGKNAIGEKGCVAKADFNTGDAYYITTKRHSFDGLMGLWDMIILPGGVKSIEKVRQDNATINLVRLHDQNSRIIATMCHGAQIMIEANLCRGRKISGYYSIKKDLENAGAEYKREVTVDANLVSAPHYDFNGEWVREWIRLWREFLSSQQEIGTYGNRTQ